MREESGNLWTYLADAIVVPTNLSVKRNGCAVMGAGVALDAAQRWPWLALGLGARLKRTRAPVTWFEVSDTLTIVCLATKRHWRDLADLSLIADGASDLAQLSDGWKTIALPRLGCGLGGLSWETQVRPILAPLLDDRFIVLTPTEAR